MAHAVQLDYDLCDLNSSTTKYLFTFQEPYGTLLSAIAAFSFTWDLKIFLIILAKSKQTNFAEIVDWASLGFGLGLNF